MNINDRLANMSQRKESAPNNGSNNNKKLTQRWVNFGIIVDSTKCQNTDTTGFAESGVSAPLDDIKSLRTAKVKGNSETRAVIGGMLDMFEEDIQALEPGEGKVIPLGNIIPEEERKEALKALLSEAGIDAEFIQKALEVAFPEGYQYGLKYYRLPAEKKSSSNLMIKRKAL